MLYQKSRFQEINIQIPLALWVLFTTKRSFSVWTHVSKIWGVGETSVRFRHFTHLGVLTATILNPISAKSLPALMKKTSRILRVSDTAWKVERCVCLPTPYVGWFDLWIYRSFIRLASGSSPFYLKTLARSWLISRVTPRRLTCPQSKGRFRKENSSSQPSMFRGYVKFSVGLPPITNHSRSYFEVFELFIGFFFPCFWFELSRNFRDRDLRFRLQTKFEVI